jgi:hypothetical protein
MSELITMYTRCPKCGQTPLPSEQAFPAECPGCGVIFAKIGALPPRRTLDAGPSSPVANTSADDCDDADWMGGLPPPRQWRQLLSHIPHDLDRTSWWLRVALLLGLAVWGIALVRMDYRTGEMGSAFVHGPLLVFHEAGHVVFRPFGEWMMILGGTLGQLLMPLLLASALLLKNRDPFGAAVGLWFVGVSVLDVAPYLYDALHPQLMLLTGQTGEEGGHDWIYLLSSMGLLARAQTLGALTHTLGALVLVASLAWAGWLLRRQHLWLAAEHTNSE